MGKAVSAALYIHIPFCTRRCGYCDFFTVAGQAAAIPDYLQAVERELGIYARQPQISALHFETLYFGGGTPSLLSPAQVGHLIELATRRFDFAPDPEITLEVNPETVTEAKLRGFRAAGVNRLSFGVQSFRPQELAFLERAHSVGQAERCFEAARRVGFHNLSLDLIYGLPGQTLASWEENLHRACALALEHISAYNLTFEAGTPLTRRLRAGEFRSLPDARQRDLHLRTMELLRANGYEHYEISNYCRPGFRSRHNCKYWDGSPYLGLGASAHSFVGSRRFWNVRGLKSYLDSLKRDVLPLAGEECLSPEQVSFERVFLGLRQRRGVRLRDFDATSGVSFFERFQKPLHKLFSADLRNPRLLSGLLDGTLSLESPWLKIEAGFLRLTDQGVVLCDAICAEFI